MSKQNENQILKELMSLRQENTSLRQENTSLRQEKEEGEKRRQEQTKNGRKSIQLKQDERRQKALPLILAILKQQPSKKLEKAKLASELRAKLDNPAGHHTTHDDIISLTKQYPNIFVISKESPGPRADYKPKMAAPKLKQPVPYVSLTNAGIQCLKPHDHIFNPKYLCE